MEYIYKTIVKTTLIIGLLVIGEYASAAIIYTDINPDVVQGASQTYHVNMDNNGLMELDIFQFSQTGPTWSSVQASGVSHDGGTTWACLVAEGATGYSKRFGANESISSTNFYENNSIMSSSSQEVEEEWNGVTNGYLGVRFLISGSTHYGWVRLNVNNAGTGFTIKDYAYESTPNTSILAGAGIVSSTFSDVEMGSLSIVAFENTIFLKDMENEGYIKVFNSFGAEVFSTKVDKGDSSFILNNMASGVYMLSVSSGNRILSRNVYIQT